MKNPTDKINYKFINITINYNHIGKYNIQLHIHMNKNMYSYDDYVKLYYTYDELVNRD